MMEISIAIFILVLAAVAAAAFLIGRKSVVVPDSSAIIAEKEAQIATKNGELLAAKVKIEAVEQQVADTKESAEKQMEEMKSTLKQGYERQLSEAKEAAEKQLIAVKEANEKQIEALKQMNKEQIDSQLKLIQEQMQTTSEKVLKARQEELGLANKEQVSKIVDPLQQSLKQMSEALKDSKEKQQEALHKLDATIQANMKQGELLSDSADRLAKALTGDVKIQGNFGELKLKQLLEDLGLKEGEQFTSQQALRDKFGKAIKDDEGKGLIPDFILHFPNNRDVIVDSKMSFTAYEKYMNTEVAEEKERYLEQHIASVRSQVKLLAGKDYSKYLDTGYGKLNFVIMYVHTEGAVNLALLNDGTLWREAYDKGVLILGPQTMYMNLRILELMWTQVRQIRSQEDMVKCANTIIERVELFATRFNEVEKSMQGTIKKMDDLKIVTADRGQSIITAAKGLIKAGAKVKPNKKGESVFDGLEYVDEDSPVMLDQGE